MHLPFLWCVLLVARSDLSLTLIERRSEINVLALEQKEGLFAMFVIEFADRNDSFLTPIAPSLAEAG